MKYRRPLKGNVQCSIGNMELKRTGTGFMILHFVLWDVEGADGHPQMEEYI